MKWFLQSCKSVSLAVYQELARAMTEAKSPRSLQHALCLLLLKDFACSLLKQFMWKKKERGKKFKRSIDISNVPKENNKTMSNCFMLPSEKTCMFKQALQNYLPCSLRTMGKKLLCARGNITRIWIADFSFKSGGIWGGGEGGARPAGFCRGSYLMLTSKPYLLMRTTAWDLNPLEYMPCYIPIRKLL